MRRGTGKSVRDPVKAPAGTPRQRGSLLRQGIPGRRVGREDCCGRGSFTFALSLLVGIARDAPRTRQVSILTPKRDACAAPEAPPFLTPRRSETPSPPACDWWSAGRSPRAPAE